MSENLKQKLTSILEKEKDVDRATDEIIKLLYSENILLSEEQKKNIEEYEIFVKRYWPDIGVSEH